MIGTGSAMTKTPIKQHIEPISLPCTVIGTISPYLKSNKKLTFTKQENVYKVTAQNLEFLRSLFFLIKADQHCKILLFSP